MTYSELKEHAGYLADQQKLSAYERALQSLLASGDEVVLDLGAGSGILGLLAARAGARCVYAVDSGPIIGPAAEVVAAAGLNGVIRHVRGRSTEVELPEPVDIAVCDQIGGFVYDAGVLEYFADARRRHLGPEGVLVPARFELHLAPVQCDRVREQLDLWSSSPVGFDFSSFAGLATNTEHRVDAEDVRVLGPGVRVATIDADHTAPVKGEGAATVETAGRCDGLVGWFVAELGGGATLTNRPDAPERMRRWCNVYPIDAGVTVQVGDRVELTVDVRPLLHAVTWTVKLTADRDETVLASERHSTLLGQFLAKEDLARSGGAPIASTKVGQALARAVELADGSRSTDEVLAMVGSEFAAVAASDSDEATVRQLLARLTDPA